MKPSEIHYGPLEESGFEEYLARHYSKSKKMILTDETVFGLWGETLVTSFESLFNAEVIQIPPGEDSKSLEICTQIWESLLEYKIGRDDLLINFGGGVVSDLGGFIASTYKRGCPYINIPTTLLAMVDASVGGKTGINLGGIKNQIGTFNAPSQVFVHPGYLSTLSDLEFLSGYAEMLKHGLIADKSHFDALKKIGADRNKISPELIRQSLAIKEHFVKLDFKDRGQRKVLNFGHSSGHAFESFLFSTGKPVPHGICVAWGMIAAAFVSFETKVLSEKNFDAINTFIRSIFPALPIEEKDIPSLMERMTQDKKNASDQSEDSFNFTLISEPGRAIPDKLVSRKTVEKALRFTVCS